MEWTEVEYIGMTMWAADFLDGVLISAYQPITRADLPTGCVFSQGYYVQEQLGDMDGPALRRRKEHSKGFEIRLVEAK